MRPTGNIPQDAGRVVHRFAQEQQRTQAELQLQLPKPYEYFSAEQYSTISTNHAPPPAGSHTVYLRESRFARDLRFEPKYCARCEPPIA